MKKINLAVAAFLLSVFCCCGQNKVPAQATAVQKQPPANNLVEKFDITEYNRGKVNGDYNHTDKNGNEVQEFGDRNSQFYTRVKLAKPSFYTSYKVYNGKTLIIKEKGTFLDNTPIGQWTYYNTDGSVAKQVDEDKKFGKFGPMQLLEYLQKEKLIDLKTGAGRQYIINISYGIQKKDSKDTSWGVPDKGQWSVTYTKSTPQIDHTYIIDSQTGKLISHKNIKGEELVK